MADSTTKRRAITEEELSKHNTEKDCWVCMHDLVFELKQDFLVEHPGGPDILTAYAGKDCTQDFEDSAHSDMARVWANKLLIGYIAGAPEEAQTKLMPSQSYVGGGRGGGAGMMPVIIVILIAVLAFIYSTDVHGVITPQVRAGWEVWLHRVNVVSLFLHSKQGM